MARVNAIEGLNDNVWREETAFFNVTVGVEWMGWMIDASGVEVMDGNGWLSEVPPPRKPPRPSVSLRVEAATDCDTNPVISILPPQSSLTKNVGGCIRRL